MKILISGITGFIGTNFTNSWSKNHTLFGLDIYQPSKEGVEHIFSWDEIGKIPQVDAIVHLAGKAHDTKDQSEAQSYFDINTGLTQRIFDYFLRSDARSFVFFSSVKAAADTVSGDILTEEVVPRPIGPYGESKIKAEEYILSKEWGDKKVYIFRPCVIHGPGNKGNLNLLYSVISKGIPYPLGAFDNRRSFTSIDNLSFVIEKTITQDIPSGIYHMGDDEALSTNELIRIISKVLEKKERIISLPKGLVHFMGRSGDLLRLPFNTFRLNKLTEDYVVSNEKIKTALGIKKMPITAEEGLTRTIRSFKKQYK